MLNEEKAGGRPVNRKSSWERQLRKRKKKTKAVTWHKRGGYHVPLFVPCTPNSELAKKIQVLEESTGRNRCVRFKVVETGGASIKSLLQRSNPWPTGQCGRPDCFPCKQEDGGDCQRSCVTYKIKCLKCEALGIIAEYKGETARNMYSRGREHLDDLRLKSDSSCMWAHCKKVHGSRVVEFSLQQTGTFSSALPRQVTEAVQIHNFKGEGFNRKQEFRQPATARAVYTRDIQEE